MSMRDTLTDAGMRTANIVHRGLLMVSGGRIGATAGSMPVVQLHTVGRKSGKARTTMLTAPIVEGGTYVLIASKGGDDRNPAWYLNLVADPDVELTVDGVTKPYTARVADGDEKATFWPRVVEAYGGYATYQTKTERDIPVVVCEPRSA